MKNKIKKIDEIWLERYFLLNELFRKARCMICSKKPLNQRLAVWQKDFDKFVLKLYEQDKRINDLIKD